MTTAIIFNAITLALLIVAAVVINKIWKEREHYRFRVFDLTNGKEGGNLLKIVSATPPPPAPKKPDIDEVEDENVTFTYADGKRNTERFADIVEQARQYIMRDCGGSFERFAEWGLIRAQGCE